MVTYNREHGKCINFVVFHHKNYAFPVLPIVRVNIRGNIRGSIHGKTRIKKANQTCI